MLQFIFGRAQSGKSYTVIEKIKESVMLSNNPILIVPEQFSFESEKQVLLTLGDKSAQKVSVMSFTRLCDEIERINGGITAKTVSDCDKIILMKRAINLSKDRLIVFKNYCDSSSFAKRMVDTVSELKLNAIDYNDLYKIRELTDMPDLAAKLNDTAVIFESYCAVLGEKFIDTSDRLTKLYYSLKQSDYFCGKTVFIDSFKGFTGQQYKIIELIIKSAQSVTVSLCNDVNSNSPFGMFSNVQKTVNTLKRTAKMQGVGVSEDIVLEGNRYSNGDMRLLEELMSGNFKEGKTECGAVTVCEAQSVYDECEYVARNIRKAVREKKYRYNDFVVIARDTAPYEDALEIACKRNAIPCFIDKRIPLLSMPVCVAAISAVNAIFDFSTENILRFHKSGINVLSERELSTIENYTYLWNLNGASWQKEWDMNPNGFTDNKDGTEDALKEINELRKKAIAPLNNFKNEFCGTPKQMCVAIIKLLEEVNIKKSLENLYGFYKEKGELVYSDAIRQSWDAFIGILESTVDCLDNANIDKKEFFDTLKTSLAFTTIGVTPQMADEVTFGDADRIRPSRPKIAFILGANQGVFPRSSGCTGIFSNAERTKLIELNIDIPDKTVGSAVDEEFLVYSNVCCASDGIFITYLSSAEDSSLAPSAFVSEICDSISPRITKAMCDLDSDNLPETAECAFIDFCKRLSVNKSDAKTLELSLNETDFKESVRKMNELNKLPDNTISSDTAHKLFGSVMSMSPSKFENLNRCRFGFFCRYGLKAESLQPAQFNAMQKGTFVHFVLQQIIDKYKGDLKDLTKEKINSEVDVFCDEYLDSISGYRSIEDTYLKYLASNIRRSIKDVVIRISDELKHSEFVPVRCELKIEDGGEIPSVKFPLDSESKMSLHGIVDRIDTYNGYVRIIDYKTGHKNFKLPDILFGQNLQMLIYLYAVTKSGAFGDKSAGIFYFPAMRNKEKKDNRIKGIVVDNDDVLSAMDNSDAKEYMFTKKSKNNFVNEGDFEKIFEYLEKTLPNQARNVINGNINANPVDGKGDDACKYCEFSGVCRMKDSEHTTVPKLSNPEVMEEIERQVNSSAD